MLLNKPLLVLSTLAACCYSCHNSSTGIPVILSPDMEKAEAFYAKGQNDSAFYYFNQVINTSTDTQQLVYAYSYMADMQEKAGDYYGAQESLVGALKYLDENKKDNYYSLSYVNTMLGNTSIDLENFDAAIDYYKLGEKFAPDTGMLIYAANGKALAYQKKSNYDSAVSIYQSIIKVSVNNPVEHARIMSNMAMAHWLRDSSYPSLPYLWQAMQIRKEKNDRRGLNASYAHLSDYYARYRQDSARYYANKMLDVATLINNPYDRLEAIQKLINLASSSSSKKYFATFQQLNDSLQTARNIAKNQFAVIRFEAEKSKRENLALQKENAEKEVQIIRHKILLYSIIGIAVTAATGTIYLFRKRKLRLEREKQEAIRNNQLKFSKKVHDVVANGLYSIISRLDYDSAFDKKQLQDKLEILYEQSRDISYEMPLKPSQGFRDKIASLLSDFSSPSVKISMVGNQKELWDHVRPEVQNEIEQVLQELMVNMKKHSQAKNVVIKFEHESHRLTILYQDDGIGMPSTLKYGNGLTSTENRIKTLGGKINFEPATTNGLKIRITIPIASNDQQSINS